MHPSTDITSERSSLLEGRRIILAMCGSVAVMRTLEVARLLMRHGATIVPVMSNEACELIGPRLVWWATGAEPIVTLGGATEHIAFAGRGPNRADLLLVCPATANTIGKIAAGIDDTSVTTFATTAIGSGMPTIVAPAMHEPMYAHPAVVRNIQSLIDMNVDVVRPRREEDKAKLAEPEYILDMVARRLFGRTPLAGKHVVVTAGRTVEYIDPIRVLSNNSSGKMGVAMARSAFRAGADVTLIYGKGTVAPPDCARTIRVDTATQMHEAVIMELDGVRTARPTDVLVAAAAVGDWQMPETSDSKISTHDREHLELTLVPTPKIIDDAKRRRPEIVLFAFRALHDLGEEELLDDARRRLTKAGADLIAVNDTSDPAVGFESDRNALTLLTRTGEKTPIPVMPKEQIAEQLIGELARFVATHD